MYRITSGNPNTKLASPPIHTQQMRMMVPSSLPIDDWSWNIGTVRLRAIGRVLVISRRKATLFMIQRNRVLPWTRYHQTIKFIRYVCITYLIWIDFPLQLKP